MVDSVAETLSIYKNGELRRTTSYSGTIRPTHANAPLRIGTRDFASFFQGAIAQVRTWGRVLTDAEINDLYAINAVQRDRLVAEYLLNEGALDIAHDTADTHHGTILGTLSWGYGSFPVEGGRVQSDRGC